MGWVFENSFEWFVGLNFALELEALYFCDKN